MGNAALTFATMAAGPPAGDDGSGNGGDDSSGDKGHGDDDGAGDKKKD